MEPEPTTTITSSDLTQIQEALENAYHRLEEIHHQYTQGIDSITEAQEIVHHWIDILEDEPTSSINTVPGDVAARDSL